MDLSLIVWYYNRGGSHDTRWLHVCARRWKKARESSREAILQDEKCVCRGLADNGVSEPLFASILHSTSLSLSFLPLLLFLHSCIAPPWLWLRAKKKKNFKLCSRFTQLITFSELRDFQPRKNAKPFLSIRRRSKVRLQSANWNAVQLNVRQRRR